MGIGVFPVPEVPGRRSQFQICALQMTPRGPDGAVSRVSDPAGGADHRDIGAAKLVLKSEVTLRAVGGEKKLDPLRAEAKEQRVVLGERHSEAYPSPDRAGL